MVDLDEFKMINDSLVHQAGDRILKHVSRNMNGMMQQGQFLARFAADEFLILIPRNHTKQGMIPPNVFIPIAEEAGLINEIGKWVLDKACKQAKKWHNQGLKALSVCVNVSGKQFQRVEFVDEVKESLRVSGLNASSLHIELTESIMLEDVEHSLWIINQLRSLGVKISVYDFGTGNSSLSGISRSIF